ncbi:hypothetical protein GC722_02400 [Auraticoccus sp. F435]|uniref:Uncharacterized protein n=1 Tax=Auraticoccus cholistanensis TaxID=2656650 RepID=A0A6A9UUK2_9ACTN|nr:hypothetical protein [Auraticoccus cholistanensis]MVA74887.1 hypothetical protein [Auraticoccus cholistanensis]
MSPQTQKPKDSDDDDRTRDEDGQGQISDGPNSLSTHESNLGGADAVPDKTTAAFRANTED